MCRTLPLLLLLGCAPPDDPGSRADALVSATETTVAASTGGTAVRALAWSDFDGDGDLDLALGTGGNVLLFRNDGGLPLTGPVWQWTPTSGTVRDLAWGDHDGDGWADLAVVRTGEPTVVFDGDGTTLVAAPSFTGSRTASFWKVIWADLDADGDLDLADCSDQGAQVHWNGASLGATTWEPDVAYACRGLGAGDVDGDGRTDLVVGTVGSEVQVYFNDFGLPAGEACVDSATACSLDTYSAREIVVADLDGDGAQDVGLVTDSGPAVAWTGFGRGGQRHLAAWSIANSSDANAAAVADEDGDGLPDLLVGVGGGAAFGRSDQDRLFRSPGGGIAWSFAGTAVGAAGNVTEDVAFADVDGDLDPDAFLGLDRSTNPVVGHLNTGFGWPSPWSFGGGTLSALAWGDLDGDGDADAVGAGASGIQVYFNDGSGGLTYSAAWSVSPGVATLRGVSLGDMDGDGDLDVAATGFGTWPSTAPNTTLYVLENTGSGLSTYFASSQTAYGLSSAWADVDDDGDLDIAVGTGAQNFPATDLLYLNTGSTFAAVTLPSSTVGSEVRFGDPDGDGDLDLAVASSGGARIYLNDGAGGLTLGWTHAGLRGSNGADFGDVDGDGDDELVVADASGLVVLDWSAGTLQELWSGSTYSATRPVFGDPDGDGDLDLLVGCGEGSQLSSTHRNSEFWVNNGTSPPTWAETWSGGSATATWHGAWVDIDSDGDLDMTLGASTNVEVFTNPRLGHDHYPDDPSVAVSLTGAALPDWSSGFVTPSYLQWSDDIGVSLVVHDDEGDPAGELRLEYSDNGGGSWQEATWVVNAILPTSAGAAHIGTWDVGADQPLGDRVRLRGTVVRQWPRKVGRSARYGAIGGVPSAMFRVRDCLPADDDGDGVGVCEGDCDDGDPAVGPNVPEACNGLDDDCSGAVGLDEADADGDAWRLCDGDCDDGAAAVYPGAAEQCDGYDGDCDLVVPDDEADGDGDGFRGCDGDCHDSWAAAYPGAVEVCDGVDDDCDGDVPEEEMDLDIDGFAECEGDCGPYDGSVWPGADEQCGDGIDNDCDGDVDGADDECPAGDDDDSSGDDDDSSGDDDDSSGDDDSEGDDDAAGDDDDSAGDDDSTGDDESAGDDDAAGDDDSAGDDDVAGDDDSAGDDDAAGDDDSSSALPPDDPRLAPGCVASCDSAAGRGSLALLLLVARRRRRPTAP